MGEAMLLGIDLGQGAVKVTALDHAGAILGRASDEYRTIYPRPGWSEQWPRDWVEATATACRALLAELHALGADAQVEGIGLTSATHHGVLLDARDRVVRPCILLTDGRATGQARRLMEAHGALILERARNVATAGWTLPQLLWVAEAEPEVWARVARITFAKDYLRLLLTGERATDWIDAEGSLLLHAADRTWDVDLCNLVPLPTQWLPQLVAPTALTGAVSRQGAALFGIRAGTPVVAGCSDTAAEALAAGACGDGQAVIKLATAGNVNLMTRAPRPAPDWFTYSHPVAGLSYHALGTNSAAASLRWFRELLGDAGDEVRYADLDAAAGAIAPGADGLLFHPYLLGERAPYWNADLRASFVGLAAAHERGHLVRAILEGVALSLADCLAVLRARGLAPSSARIIGGGARSRLWRQIVSDVLGLPLLYPAMSDASCGAALLAGVGVGVYASPEQAAERTGRILAEHIPDSRVRDGYARLLAIYQDVQSRLEPIGPLLKEVRFT